MARPEGRLEQRRRSRPLGWSHLIAAIAVGAVLGSMAHAAPRLVGAATDGPASELQALAREYLQAIADGEADRASELSPVRAGLDVAPAAMLQSAGRIRPLAVEPALVDGDEGTIAVRYEVAGTEIARELHASRMRGEWQLTTSLTEAPDTESVAPPAVLRIAGLHVPLHDELYLYPGVYRLDAVEGPLFATDGGSIVMDGDPGSRTRVHVRVRLMDAFRERLAGLAVDAMAACTARPTCPVRAQAAFEVAGEPALHETIADGRTIDLRVPLLAREGSVWEWRAVIVRVELDARGLPVEWGCSVLGDLAGPVPCGP